MMVSSSMGAEEEDCGGSTVKVAVLVLDILTVMDAIDDEKQCFQCNSIHPMSTQFIHRPA